MVCLSLWVSHILSPGAAPYCSAEYSAYLVPQQKWASMSLFVLPRQERARQGCRALRYQEALRSPLCPCPDRRNGRSTFPTKKAASFHRRRSRQISSVRQSRTPHRPKGTSHPAFAGYFTCRSLRQTSRSAPPNTSLANQSVRHYHPCPPMSRWCCWARRLLSRALLVL